MATITSPQGARFKVLSRGFQVSTFPPYLASPFWPTAPYVPAPKFVIMPQNVRFVPEYNWGCPDHMPDPNCACRRGDDSDEFGALGDAAARKRRAKKKAAKLRAKAIKIEKKAGIVKKVKKAVAPKKDGKSLFQKASAVPAAPAQQEAQEEPAEALPTPEGVPQNAEEGSSNMKLIIGGTLALMAAIGIGFAMQQSRKRSAYATAPAAPMPTMVPARAPVATLPAPAPVRTADEVAAEFAEMPISANPRGRAMLTVRPSRV
jgi:hypothetical protein